MASHSGSGIGSINMFCRNSSRSRKGNRSSNGLETMRPSVSRREAAFGEKGWSSVSITSQILGPGADKVTVIAARQVAVLRTANERDLVGIGNTLHVGEAHAAFGVAAHQGRSEIVALRLANGMVATVIEHEKFDGKLVVDDRLQLLQVHLNAAIAGQTYHGLTFRRDTGPNGRRHIKPHRRRTGITEHALPSFASAAPGRERCRPWRRRRRRSVLPANAVPTPQRSNRD